MSKEKLMDFFLVCRDSIRVDVEMSHSSGLESFLVSAPVGFSCSAPDLSEDPVGSSSSSE